MHLVFVWSTKFPSINNKNSISHRHHADNTSFWRLLFDDWDFMRLITRTQNHFKPNITPNRTSLAWLSIMSFFCVDFLCFSHFTFRCMIVIHSWNDKILFLKFFVFRFSILFLKRRQNIVMKIFTIEFWIWTIKIGFFKNQLLIMEVIHFIRSMAFNRKIYAFNWNEKRNLFLYKQNFRDTNLQITNKQMRKKL